ncbi:MAG: protein kinase [Archangiaceae bacterium]|nr:protein kinase [Archangiaceae bacterium]
MERFGKFELVRRLGAGGMGEVFLARSADLGQVVVKRILPHLTENPRFLRLFLDETRIAARLSHPNIARIHELGEVGDTWYVAMELVQGKDLRQLLKRMREQGGSIPVPVALFIAREIALALAYAHELKDASGKSLKVVHRDVSPHNIVVSQAGAVKLIDFGVARAANKSVHTASGILKGKFPYMAPEQATAKKVDGRTDVFALGIVLWEMLAGQPLFRGKTDAQTLKAVRACDVVAPSRFDPIVPRAVDKLVLRALQKDPKDRFPTADAMREALEDAMAGMPAPAVVQFYRDLDDVPGLPDESGENETDAGTEATVLESPRSTNSGNSLHVRERPVRPEPEVTVSGRNSKVLKRVRKVLGELADRPTNLVPVPSTFVGRVAELADLQQLFRQGFRLLTLLGAAGTGKTRLATQFAGQLVSHFRASEASRKGGVWFVDLTDARDIDSVCAAVARALSVPLSPGNVVLQLSHVIASRGDVLLVLDNFEQVARFAEATVGAWLAAAPDVRFVVTSRELLKVAGETVFEVPPPRVPEALQEVKKSESVMLFVDRARIARPGWELTQDEESAVAELVRQLDGMPLAIELAASRMGTLNPSQLVQRMPRRFDLLSSGAHDRQATLRGAIDWSWHSLTSQEATVLAQCAVFRGGFTIEAAEAVVSLAHFEEPPAIMEVLLTLRSKSLIRSYYPRGDELEPRYGLYESIREYAFERLQGTPIEKAAHERHARYFLELGSQLAATADGNVEQLDWLELERDNLYAVFQRSIDSDETGPRPLLAMAALDPLLTLRGPFGHHLAMLDAAIERLGPDLGPRASALELRGRARQSRGKTVEAAEDYAEMLDLAQQLGDVALEGRAEFYTGLVERLRGQRREAQLHFERALMLLRQVKDRRTEGRTLSSLAVLLHELSLENDATAAYQRALEIHRAMGDRRYEGITLANLGVLQQAQGLLSQSRQQYEQALAIHRELGNRRSEGIAHINLGDLNRDLGKFGAAGNHYQSALAILREVGARRFEGVTLFSMGSWHQEQGQAQQAAERLQAALPLLAEADDRRYGGLAMAALAAAEAVLGHDAEVDEALGQATRLLTEAGDASFLDALEVYRGIVELAHARFAREAVPYSVTRRQEHAETPGVPSPENPAGTPSPAERSEQVRAALRSLKAVLESEVQ